MTVPGSPVRHHMRADRWLLITDLHWWLQSVSATLENRKTDRLPDALMARIPEFQVFAQPSERSARRRQISLNYDDAYGKARGRVRRFNRAEKLE